MFIGHYGVSFAAKRFAPRQSLGTLFLAVQLLDVLFALFVFAGLEKLRIVPGFTQYNPYDLYYMPYSHSLAGALGWSVAAGLVALAFGGRRAALWIGAAVFSHFLLDVPMHTPDMPILGNDSPKLGLGLWRHRDLALAAELLALGLGLWIWWRAPTPRPRPRRRTAAFVGFVGVLVVLTLATPFLPPPADGTAFAWQALTGYVVLAAVAGWLDRSAIQ
jgi:heme A synthase